MSRIRKMDDGAIVYEMLKEAGIPCKWDGYDAMVYVGSEPLIIYPPVSWCNRPKIADPDFIEKVKEFVKFCSKRMAADCDTCPNYSDIDEGL